MISNGHGISNPRLSAVLVRIDAAPEVKRRCAHQLAEFAALESELDPEYRDRAIEALEQHPNDRQVALLIAMARLHRAMREHELLHIGAEKLGGKHPAVTAFHTQLMTLANTNQAAITTWEAAEGCARAMPQHGRVLVRRIESTMTAFNRAKLMLIAKARIGPAIHSSKRTTKHDPPGDPGTT